MELDSSSRDVDMAEDPTIVVRKENFADNTVQKSQTGDAVDQQQNASTFHDDATVAVSKNSVSEGTKKPGRLAQPLPLWSLLIGVGLIIVVLVVLHLTGQDWAAGAAHASTAALIIGLVVLIALVARTIDGMASQQNPKRLLQYAISVLCIVVLLVYSGVAQTLQPMLHSAQAHSLEDQQQWQAAINEYTLGGAREPGSEDLARTYASWGLALVKAHRYNDALAKFTTVLTGFSQDSVDDQFNRAQNGNISAWFGLSQQYMQQKDYIDATAQFDTILKQNYCDLTCQHQASTTDATAYYDLGEARLQTGSYANAVAAFDTVLTTFSTAPEAKQLHGDMAKALLGQGKATLAGDCSSSVPVYQRLAKEYGDTPQGKQASHDLNAPQTIQGTFVNSEKDRSYTMMGLVQGLHGGLSTDDLFNAWGNATQQVTINNDGSFTFTGVKQGHYDLLWYGNDGTYEYAEFMYAKSDNQPRYTVQVGPLCSVNVGQVSNNKLGLNI